MRLPIHKHMCNLPLVFACVLGRAGLVGIQFLSNGTLFHFGNVL